ncbi:unnamed protein product [Phyllotreta striolata]|uniref:Uncharacterized protein n=1 Tax=Phyllotreta striolata TaxID=444603 RepID=A0A9N9TAW7_PHYSR|nr:unnamed protein product [Phyllotreta striolata]
MDATTEVDNPNPREKANIFSIIFFVYTLPIFKKGVKKDFEAEDLYNTLESDRSSDLGSTLERNWIKQKSKPNNKKPKLLHAVWNTYWIEYLRLGILVFLTDIVLRVSQPYVLGLLLDYYNPQSSTSKEQALGYAGLIVAFNAFSSFIRNQFSINAKHVGMRARVAASSLIYRKALKLSNVALGKNSVGKIVNLLSNDVNRFDMAPQLIHQLWVGPLTAIAVMYIIFRDIGMSCMAGIVTIILMSPLQAYIGRLSAKYRRKTALKTDERIRLMDEVITGIQVIKMYAWEKPFAKLIALARKAEINIIKRGQYVRGIFMAFNMFNNRFALFATLATMVFQEQAITASRVYVYMSYYQILANTLAGSFVNSITQYAELMVSINRMQDFLESEEHQQPRLLSRGLSSDGSKDMVVLKDVTAVYDESSSEPALKNINIRMGSDFLLGVMGPVGSGKSSLLQTLLGETSIIQGGLTINGTISYASQEPWIFSATIRQNILFGSPFDQKRYDRVIRVCELQKDINQFADRDFTVIGENGANLSGGQKARVNLARAIYKEADIYLLDDPLSAVDIMVSKVLYEDCIQGFLSGKTRILVTHQVHYLNTADHVIVLNGGNIEIEGTYSELVKSENPLTVHLTEEENEIIKRQLSISEASVDGDERKTSVKNTPPTVNGKIKDVSKQMQEKTSKGTIEGSLLWKYFRSGLSVFEMMFLVALLGTAQGAASLNDWYMSFWTNAEEARTLNLTNSTLNSEYPTTIWSSNTYLILYSGILAVCLITTMLRSILYYKFIMTCAEKMHGALYRGVTSTYMSFFDQNPSGRILNRFSKDIGTVDEGLPAMLFMSTRTLLGMVGHLALVLYVNPYTLIIVAILTLIFSFVRHIYLRSSNNIKRLEGRMKSPVFNHLTATLQGLTTIRAYKAETILKAEFDRHQDRHSSSWFMFISANTAFGFSLDLICLMFIGSITFSLILLGEYFKLTGGDVGLAINQATALTSNIQFLVLFSANISNQLMSVERVLEYRELKPELQPEKPLDPGKTWPKEGNISIENLVMKYEEDGPQVLKDITVHIKPKEKIGIVGRTGAGKSSLIASIFRLTAVEGKIQIDNVNTKDITLEQLRSKVSIIPQDPILFSGTLRYNLDPFDEYSDEVLYRAINEVELRDPNNIINRLENRVMVRGSNYSVGQRQLICLARAIIRNNKILVLDEATANVDPQTDVLIQKTIRDKFSDCTVLTVAHRLNTIIDSDKILVLSNGEVQEFNHPYLLLKNEQSAFRKMVEEAGQTTLKLFEDTSGSNYQRSLDSVKI